MKKLDLGCGTKKKSGCIGVDIVQLPGVDIVADINKRLPFTENEFDVVFLDNVLEHVIEPIEVLKEIHRISKPRAKIFIEVPFYNSPIAYVDPTHKTVFHPTYFSYFDPGHHLSYYFDFHFKTLQIHYIPNLMGKLLPKSLRLKVAQTIGNIFTAFRVILETVK